MFAAIAGPASAATGSVRPDATSTTEGCWYTAKDNNQDLYSSPRSEQPNGAVLQVGDGVISAPNTVGSGSDPWVFVWVGSADFHAATGFVQQDALNGAQPSCDTPTGPYENP